MNAKKRTKEFRNQYNIDVVNSARLCEVIRDQGYTVVEFNGVNDTKDVRCLIDSLQLQDQITHSKCFTYQDDKYRVVFIHEDLNEEERVIVLAHEEGHIWDKHLTQRSVFGEDIVQEYEANEFAHYLLEDKTGQKRKARTIAVICAILILVIFTGVFFKQNHDKTIYTDHYYRTDDGTKYHLRDCMFIKDKTNIVKLTREEFESEEYEPCEACMPDKRK